MAHEIDLKSLKDAVNAVLDHLIEDLEIEKVNIADEESLYWDCDAATLKNMASKPLDFSIGSLRDDVDFVKIVRRGQSGDVSYNLVHIFPILRFLGEKIKR
jgi:hypothetical protein